MKVQEWLWTCDGKHCISTCCIAAVPLLKSLGDFPRNFINLQYSEDVLVTYDDEDLNIWELQAKRWAKVLFLIIKEEHDLDPTLMVCFLIFLLFMDALFLHRLIIFYKY